MDFKNEDVIITDPCYVVANREDWKKCTDAYSNDGKHDITDGLKKLGFTKVISNDTVIGDWCCEVFKIDGEKIKLGDFGADSGLVAVFSLDEILKYDPDYDYKEDEDIGCAVIIRNFTGRVSIEQVDDRTISVVGQGSIDFYSEIME